MIRIYFNTSVRISSDVKESSKKITDYLQTHDYELVYDISQNLSSTQFDRLSEEELKAIYKSAINSIKRSKIVILEISNHSLSQGLLLEKALQMNKPVIALHKQEFHPNFFKGINNNLLQIVEYNNTNLVDNLSISLTFAKENLESRFNFYLSPDINNYLKWGARKHKISRSAFVRHVLQLHMSESKEFVR